MKPARYRLFTALCALAAAVLVAACAPIPPVDPEGSSKHHAQVGKHFYLSGTWPRAEKEFREALRLNPKNEEAAEYLAYLLYRNGRLLQAEEMAGRSLELNPGSGRSYLVLAGCLHGQGKNKEALGAVRRALSLLRRKDDRQQAQELIEEIQAAVDGTAPRKDAFKAAQLSFRREEWDTAAVQLEDILRTSPRDSAALELHALLLLRSYKTDEAAAEAGKILNRYPGSATGLFVLGMCRRLRNDEVNAVPLLEKARQLADPYTLAMHEKFRNLPPAPVDTVQVVRLATALMPLGTVTAAADSGAAPDLRTLLAEALDETGRFLMVGHARVDSVLGTLTRAHGAVVGIETAIQAGTALGCDAVITGSVSTVDSVIEVDIRLIEVRTAQALAAAGGRSAGSGGIHGMCGAMAADLRRQLQ